MPSTLMAMAITLKESLWSGPVLISLVYVGIYLTWQLRGIQFRYLWHAFALLLKPSEKQGSGDLSAYQTLMTALAGAIGTGNITGIAVAIYSGGFGALFWMWVIGALGMATAYSETILAIRFRRVASSGLMLGGPMTTLADGLGKPRIGKLFALLAMIASLGIGATIQSNSVAGGMHEVFQIPPVCTGLVMAILAGLVILGGVKSIGRVAGVLVPVMAISYLLASFCILFVRRDALPLALINIFRSAFSGQAAIGGFLGASTMAAVHHGVVNGFFANEAGLGSLAMAAASAKTKLAAKQGMFAMVGVFMSTMLISTSTGLVLAVTNLLGSYDENGVALYGSALTIASYASVFPPFKYLVLAGLGCFAFTTVFAWAHYGERCLEFLIGRATFGMSFRVFYIFVVFLGAIVDAPLIWVLANLANGLMALPNLYSVYCLRSVVQRESEFYEASLKGPT